MSHPSSPSAAWRRHLTDAERGRVAELDEAIDLHARLVRPLQAERRRLMSLAATRLCKRGEAPQADAA